MKNSLFLMLVICISACTSKPETQEQREQRIKQETDKEVEQLANKLFPHERWIEIQLILFPCKRFLIFSLDSSETVCPSAFLFPN